MNRPGRYLIAFAAAAMVAGCGVKESFKDAEAEVARFHAALDAGDAAGIYRRADPSLRLQTSRDNFERLIGAVHRKLGKVKASKQVGWNATTSTGGSFVTVTMQTTFERGEGTEQLSYRKRDDKRLALSRYDIKSEAMLLN